jgi:hypothetical protein
MSVQKIFKNSKCVLKMTVFSKSDFVNICYTLQPGYCLYDQVNLLKGSDFYLCYHSRSSLWYFLPVVGGGVCMAGAWSLYLHLEPSSRMPGNTYYFLYIIVAWSKYRDKFTFMWHFIVLQNLYSYTASEMWALPCLKWYSKYVLDLPLVLWS